MSPGFNPWPGAPAALPDCECAMTPQGLPPVGPALRHMGGLSADRIGHTRLGVPPGASAGEPDSRLPNAPMNEQVIRIAGKIAGGYIASDDVSSG